MNGPLILRLVREQRVRLPLEVLLIAIWGFLLVAVFATSEVFTKQLEAQAEQFGGLLDLVGLDPLAQWASIGFQHPIFLLGGGLFSVGLGIRAIAGELEACACARHGEVRRSSSSVGQTASHPERFHCTMAASPVLCGSFGPCVQ